jgi:hypothetical protein
MKLLSSWKLHPSRKIGAWEGGAAETIVPFNASFASGAAGHWDFCW